ncbi:tetraacyldisaccharide 4'-kinase [Isoalcanivorax indicus]|uniref:tetraacyldisaccharide 4'-kinase n=1 Tax=Isoalcanivorax indicus TaxID=2202653 RepID=UPI000DB900B4|nr:tetraacyldisaccharide 4'-kinase [Isoalcanivorax indicus]
MSLAERVSRAWYRDSAWLTPLRPLGALTARVARRRLGRLRKGPDAAPVPVLVVGNITVGGTGKTPLVIALCRAAAARGIKVVVISRGYGARPPSLPWTVTPQQSAAEAGDEPLLISHATDVPVIIDPQRVRALTAALDLQPDLVISDDGLQHYALARTAEIAVVDARRGLGNGRCLPAGPLREPASRLDRVDWVVINGDGPFRHAGGVPMQLDAPWLENAASQERVPLAAFVARYPQVHALAGIGDPERFFGMLRGSGFVVQPHPFPDHHAFVADDLALPGDAPVIMTEKDLVKCRDFVSPRCWVLPVTATLPPGFIDRVLAQLVQDTEI